MKITRIDFYQPVFTEVISTLSLARGHDFVAKVDGNILLIQFSTKKVAVPLSNIKWLEYTEDTVSNAAPTKKK